ncbi:MAG TPA: hypothetical protein PKE01_09210 [Rhodocyclaceae bacterium]|uniref:hypothetical protein n=1 Tax=Zoogloea sp. TaxID=49181 RepID=UPI002C5A9F7C|nr:hypothetical protein [Zoogloea sp.]HMV63504.1 hypothetical protein [Rhodocyclaceae bacterium]HMW52125.1 hypothetical protein [Rhodocyclaceae bacterium]HMY48439.1 hypothetical protein [Rhodocyclaceae bacterium]HMZ75919.1 hypothetical protein [Rhodocyclaceae bacterium]HNA67967.1 hypothetical protein [Rhodocyclaceae bacterium]
MKHIAILMILGSSAVVQAAPIPVVFNSESYTTSAFASVPNGQDGPYTDVASPPGMTQITSATASDAGGGAFASGIVDSRFLGASADVTHSSGDAFGSGIATYEGRFDTAGGLLRLTLNFDAQVSGSAANLLNVVFVANGVTLFDDNFSLTGEYALDFLLPQAASGVLDLTLSSTADSTAGSGFGLSSTFFALNSVPTPGGLALCLLGLGGLALNRGRRVSSST